MRIQVDLPYCDKVDSIAKANSVQFVDLTPFDQKIMSSFRSVEDVNKFRLNLYNLYKTKVKIEFIKISEDENNFIKEKQGFKLSSDVFSLTDNDIWRCLPFYVVKNFYRWSSILHKYISRENLLFFSQYI